MVRVSSDDRMDVCTRCLQRVPHGARKCPHCFTPRVRTRRLNLSIGIAGLVALLFLIFVMVRAVQDADLAAAPPDDQDEDSISAPATTGAPAQPDKPPPVSK